MIICFKCDRETKKILDSFLSGGDYKDYAEIIASAVQNLAVLQGNLASSKSIILSENHLKEDLSVTADRSCPSVKPSEIAGIGWKGKHTFTIPKLLTLDGLKGEFKKFAQPPVDKWSPGDVISVNEWIFGQYNKLLPAKVSCRAIARILYDWPDGVELENMPEVSQQAAAMGDFLKEVDARYGLNRDEAFSTAFPSSEDRSGKGLVRYAHHFVGQINKKRELSGLLFDFKLINTIGHGLPHVKLTEKGWRFTILPNPILDCASLKNEVERFSSEEVQFLLNLIRDFIPREDYAYRIIIRAILEGANTPTSLDLRLHEVTPKIVNKNLTQGFLSSQRSGAISRMVDLGLVTRIRKGVKVVYNVNSKGEGYLQNK